MRLSLSIRKANVHPSAGLMSGSLCAGLLLALVATSVVAATPISQPAPRPPRTPGVTVEVQYVDCTPALTDSESTLVTDRTSAPGVAVAAVPAGDGAAEPLVRSATSGFGATVLRLPAGAYWVYVPLTPTDPGGAPAVLAAALPDGTPVGGWSAVEITDDTRAATTAITISLFLSACAPAAD